ncbi:unnamed protein product [Coregonus sp. 'balchen']|nr:unnamed protein product [Coregonus sp. 'balchen']
MSDLIFECVAPLRSFAFGSCQERKLFPIHCAPNRLGNDLSLQGAPHLALAAMTIMLLLPFCMMYRRDLRVKRDTLLRQGLLHGFCTIITHSPQKYQQDRTWCKVYPLGRTPFNSTTKRFRTKPVTADSNTGCSWGHLLMILLESRKVLWPMNFGSQTEVDCPDSRGKP